MQKKEIALGAEKKVVVDLIDNTMYKAKMQATTEDMLNFLISRINTLERLTAYLYENLAKEEENSAYNNKTISKDTIEAVPNKSWTESNIPNGELNKDNIPINTLLIGVSMGRPYILTVNKYDYCVGTKTYDTLSAAAEAVSGNRRSGWVFWKTSDGRTAKEAFNNNRN